MARTIEQLKDRAAELLKSDVQTREQIDILNDTAWNIRNADPQLVKRLAQTALLSSNREDYSYGRAFALKNMGWSQIFIGDYVSAEQSLDESCQIFTKLVDDDNLALTVNGLATAQKLLSKSDVAINNYSKALNLSQKIGNETLSAVVQNNLSGIYTNSADYAQALELAYQAHATLLKSNADFGRLALLDCTLGNNLRRVGETQTALEHLKQSLILFHKSEQWRNKGISYVNFGGALQLCREYEKAFDKYARGFELAQRNDYFDVQSEAQIGIGHMFYETGEVQKSLEHSWQGLQIARAVKSRLLESEALLWFGCAFIKLGDLTESQMKLEEALDLSRKFDFKEVQYKTHFALSELYEIEGNAAAALAHYRAFHQIWDEIYGLQVAVSIQRLLFANEFGADQSNNARKFWQQDRFVGEPLAANQKQSALSPHKLAKIIEFINHHLEEKLTLDDLAAVVGFNARYLQRAFKQSTGKTPQQYLLERRVDHARRLIETTALPLAEIALQCGFSSQAHLTTQFRLATGITPHKLR